MEPLVRHRWDAASLRYDFFSRGAERRWALSKRRLFAVMRGRVLFLAAGTGLDFPAFPPDHRVTAIEISPRMLERARPRAKAYRGSLDLVEMDAEHLAFPDNTFDQVFTACTFCSVPDPVQGLCEVRRVLKPGGWLHMFEHTGSRWFPFNIMLRLMNPVSRRSGPELVRDTPGNVRKAGLAVREVRNLYLDVIKTIHAEKTL